MSVTLFGRPSLYVMPPPRPDGARECLPSAPRPRSLCVVVSLSQRSEELQMNGDDQEIASQAMPPHAQLIQMGTASWVSAVVYAAAKLGLAD